MGFARRFCALLLASLSLSGLSAVWARAATPHAKLLVRVPADRTLGERKRDERPAEITLRADEFGKDLAFDLSSLLVGRVDRIMSDFGPSPEVPLRWYDDAIPYEFPEYEQNLQSTDGVNRSSIPRPRWGDFYNVCGDGLSGKLVWLHTQEGKADSYYLVSARLIPREEKQPGMPHRGLVGDGSHRCLPRGSGTTGMIHSRVAVADWNDDGLADLLIGGARGHVLCYDNRGTKTRPQFELARLVNTLAGEPLDVGWSAAPLAVDWDEDGDLDLLCGAERNRILFYRNRGSRRMPQLVNEGFLRADEEPIALPVEPVPKSAPGVFTLDYYPVLDAVDWNGDGRRDLLAGGYITGRVFYFECTGKNANGDPTLVARGPLLTADGAPLNVHDWAAAPCAADFDGDGDLDLVVGNMPLNDGGGDSTDPDNFLRYFENGGDRKSPRLAEKPFPKTGKFPHAILGTPRATDLNADGLLDLVVSAGENVFLYFNRGTPREPKFAVDALPLPGIWGSAPLPTFGLQFLDWDGDGKRDILTGTTIYYGKGNDEYRPESLLASGLKIDHPSTQGDSWTYTQLADLDGDGRRDLLFGTHSGHIWLHSQRGEKPGDFDEQGVQLQLEGGEPLHVGPQSGQAIDFDVLQGARTAFAAADFNADGVTDLVVGDTYGKVRCFRNVGTPRVPRFAGPLEVGDMRIRMTPAASDWDGDGRLDIVGSSAGGDVALFRNLGGDRFAPAEPIRVPPVPYSPSAVVVDWNDDGDADVVIGTAYGYFCWFERSFLEKGYARGERVTQPP